MTNSVGSGILGFRRCGPGLSSRISPGLILARHYNKLRVCPAELPCSEYTCSTASLNCPARNVAIPNHPMSPVTAQARKRNPIDTSKFPGTGRRWPNCTRSQKCNLPAPDISCKGPPPPRLDDFAATCYNSVPLRPRHCNPLQRRQVRSTSPTSQAPPARYAIQVRMPATDSQPRTLSDRSKMPSRMSKRVR